MLSFAWLRSSGGRRLAGMTINGVVDGTKRNMYSDAGTAAGKAGERAFIKQLNA